MFGAQGRPGTVDGEKWEATVYAFTVISMAEGLGNKLGKAILQVKKKWERKGTSVPPHLTRVFLWDGTHSWRHQALIVYGLPLFIFLLQCKFLRESRKIFVRKQLFSSYRLTFLQAMQQMNQYKCFLQNTEIFYLFRNRSHNIARWTISIKPKDDKKIEKNKSIIKNSYRLLCEQSIIHHSVQTIGDDDPTIQNGERPFDNRKA